MTDIVEQHLADEKPWIARVGNRGLGAFFTLLVAKTTVQLQAQQGDGLGRVSHQRSGEEWIGVRDAQGNWSWKKTGRASVAETEDEPPRRRWRADIDG